MTRGLSALSRADLLRALSLAPDDAAAAARFADLLRFVARPPRPPAPDLPAVAALPQQAPLASVAERLAADSAAPARQALRASLAGAVRVQPIAGEPVKPVKPEGDAAALKPPPDPRPRAPGRLSLAPPLVRPQQLWPSLRGSLTVGRLAGVDFTALTHELARARPLRRLPRQWRAVWGGELWLIIDTGERMRPYAADFALVWRQIVRLRGRGGLRVWRVDGRPDRLLGCPGRSVPPIGVEGWPLPPADTVVLVLSDAGALARDSGAEQTWLALMRRLGVAGARPVCWAPMAPAQVGRELAACAAVHCLQPGAALKRQRGRWATPTQREAERRRLDDLLDDLRVRVSCCLHLAVDLLRDLRLTHPALRAEPALEALYWTDQPRVGDSPSTRPLAPTAAAGARQRLKSLPLAERIAALGAMLAHHASHPRSIEAIECSTWLAHADLSAHERPAALQQAIGAAQDWLRALTEHLAASFTVDLAARCYAADLLERQGQDQRWQRTESDMVATVWAASDLEAAPPGVDDSSLVRARQQRLKRLPRAWQLIQRGADLWLWPAETESPARSSDMRAGGRAAEPVWRSGDAIPRRIAAEGPERLCRLDSEVLPVTLTFDDASVTIDIVGRPRWALEWARDAKGLYALAPTPWGAPARIDCIAGADGIRWVADAGAVSRPGLVVRNDPTFGVFAELRIAGNAGEVAQRLRWLPPGEFWMGSTDAERALLRDKEYERYARNESPRHRVRLTSGFWLADTACTQALWLAVMGGKNPSHFTGDPNLPLENVSYDDVQTFLKRLQALLPPGCEAGLPTESQWEYACRAGTETAFSFGDRITPEQVNYDGNHPFGDAPKGSYRERTVAVASLPPNAWGLYEMHGNVLEWCDDGLRQYEPASEAEPAIDPTGLREQGPEAPRAVRGGSWGGGAGSARSAYRYAIPRVDRYANLGFRLALRSTSPVAPEGPASQGISGPGPEAPDPPARRDAGPARGALRGLVDRVLGRGENPMPPAPPPKRRR